MNDTMTYLRLRRNRLVHNDGTPSQKLASVIRNKGKSLNTFWSGRLGHLDGLDFKDSATGDFDLPEVIDLIRVIRALADAVDSVVCSLLEPAAVLRYLNETFEAEYGGRLRSLKRERREIKFTNWVFARFNFRPDPDSIVKLSLGDP